jgi:hypothetical protein
MADIDPDTCEHDYELDSTVQTERGAPNVANLKCKLCGHQLARRTLKSVATIKAEAADANA